MSFFKVDPNMMVYTKWLHIFVVSLVLVGAINWLAIGFAGVDLVRQFLPPRHAKWVYLVIGLAGLSLLFRRDMYLPFLGETVLPGGALSQKVPQNANDQVTIRTIPNAKVVYWAAEPNPTQGTDIPNWTKAYGEFENSGVAIASADGSALLRFRGPPQVYSVPMHGRLEPHIHFRICGENGMMGDVQTMNIKNGDIEAFSNMV